ncbi:hypothetical protein [Paraburkholderia oxyphila]|uniref:hypothetical protein n=1 Tax=Paraburkholderia oxyphila TaxID=614212 RepID=UPI0005BA6534|nr:hypothetical protein [Paraburkholderia oxyphila]
MKTAWRWSAVLVALSAIALAMGSAIASAQESKARGVQHVLLISFDGLHEQDVARCIGGNSCPNLALLAARYHRAAEPGHDLHVEQDEG